MNSRFFLLEQRRFVGDIDGSVYNVTAEGNVFLGTNYGAKHSYPLSDNLLR